VYFLGSPGQRRKMKKLLKWSVYPYPKAEAVLQELPPA
jgi:hypothetical protein